MNGAAVLLEQLLNRDLLYLPCRHHILEIILAECFEKNIPGISGPNVPLFKRFCDSWESIDKTQYKEGLVGQNEILILSHKKINVQQFIDSYLTQQLSRDDYKELLLLCKYFLSCPKSDVHHARWMAKAIYSLEIFLFRGTSNSLKKKKPVFLMFLSL